MSYVTFTPTYDVAGQITQYVSSVDGTLNYDYDDLDRLIEITGGEPLGQRAVLPLMEQLCNLGFLVLIETSGAYDIAPIDLRVRIIMDLKCPSSGEVARNLWENISHLKAKDEVKFVISTTEDYEWAKEQIQNRELSTRCPLIFSWASPLTQEQRDRSLKVCPPDKTPISRRELVDVLLADALPVRFQVQLHKVIWPPDKRSV